MDNLQDINIVSFDLDGTLLNNKSKVGLSDYQTLINLEKNNILRVAATGRNLYSLQKIIPPSFPMDYAIFSSGAGIFNWKTKQIIHSLNINKKQIEFVIKLIKQHKLNFTVHLPIPNNHHILLYDKFDNPTDLRNYVNNYKKFSSFIKERSLPSEASQMIILLNDKEELIYQLSEKLNNLKTIRTTSPVNNCSIWLEVFNKEVSKAKGMKKLINILNIKEPKVFFIGNDYNDLDLLKSSQFAFVVKNAPNDLLCNYKNASSNNDNALTNALAKCTVK